MASLESCHCRGARGQKNSSNSILYSILKNDQQPTLQQRAHRLSSSSTSSSSSSSSSPASLLELRRQQACSCGSSRRRGALRSPQVTCKAASAVLVKTLRFVKNVPCFRELPQDDQLLLVRNGWAPLLVLGLAQDRVDFETTESAEPSMLQRILTGSPDRPSELPVEARAGVAVGVSLAEIQSIKAFLKKCWSLDISTKEYAYLKGAVLFNPDLQGLRCLLYIQSLRQEAHQALNEHVRLSQQEDPARFAKLLLALSMLRSIQPLSVAQLFFKPVIGTVNMDEVLMEMFYGK